MDKTLSKVLIESGESFSYHMPGHKNNYDKFPYLKTYIGKVDNTEISGLDNLQNPKELLRYDLDRISKLYGSKKSFISVNGSTCSLITSIFACTKPKDHVLVQRNSHKSIFNGITLRELIPTYIDAEYISDFNIFGVIDPSKIERALNEDANIKLVIITSPSYEGIISDIKTIAKIVHKHNAILLVDEAHGAHLGLDESFNTSSIKLGADIVCESLHKTMPVINPCSLIHICSDKVNQDMVQKYLNMFQTSSPSYVALYTISEMLDMLESKVDIFETLKEEIDDLRVLKTELKNIKLLNYKEKYDENKIFKFDNTKILVKINENLIGVANKILKNNKVIPEYFEGENLLFMLGPGDTKTSYNALKETLIELDNLKLYYDSKSEFSPNKKPIKGLNPYEIESLNTEYVKLSEANGRIIAEKIYNYPPGSPMIMEGEIIDEELIKTVIDGLHIGKNIISDTGKLDNLLVLCVLD